MNRELPIICLTFLFVLHSSQVCVAAERGGIAPADPFAYCAAIRNIDIPAGGASPVPAVLKPHLKRALGLPGNSEIVPESYFWRCMGGAVYVCAIGANIPCDAKADRAKRNSGAERYCIENPNASFVPAYATGHATIYGWTCSAGNAVPGKRLGRVDHRGFQVDFWYRVDQ